MIRLYRLVVAAALVTLPMLGMSQTTLYFENFGTTRVLPAGWISTSPGWIPDSSNNVNNNSPLPQYSGSFHLNIRNDEQDGITPPAGTYSVTTPTLDATLWTDLEVSWAARRTSNFQVTQVMTLEYSLNGAAGPWTALTYTDRPADATWGDVGPVAVPAANNASQLAFRLTTTTRQASGTYRVDDFKVEGTQTVGLSKRFVTLPVVWLQAGRQLTLKAQSPVNGPATLRVLNTAGQPVHQSSAEGDLWNLDLASLPAGVYLVHAQVGGDVAVRRVVLR